MVPLGGVNETAVVLYTGDIKKRSRPPEGLLAQTPGRV
jgi:hypothetical protein